MAYDMAYMTKIKLLTEHLAPVMVQSHKIVHLASLSSSTKLVQAGESLQPN